MSFRPILQADTLIGPRSTAAPVSSLDGKTLMIYFSASWCPPCRGFTPQLVEYYSHLSKDKAEILFVSMDKDEAAFQAYFHKMPWLALPFSCRAQQSALASRFQVSGIPCLVILDKNGGLITKNGRNVVPADPRAEGFPYTAETAEVLAGKTAGGQIFQYIRFAFVLLVMYLLVNRFLF